MRMFTVFAGLCALLMAFADGQNSEKAKQIEREREMERFERNRVDYSQKERRD